MKEDSKLVDDNIIIFVKDWNEELDMVEPNLTGDDPIINMVVEGGMKPQQAGRMFIMAGERGLIDSFPGSKTLLMSGGAFYVSTHISNQKKEIELKNGKTCKARAYVAPIRGEDDENHQDDDTQPICVQSSPSNWLKEKVVGIEDEKAAEWAISYLLKKPVPGLIYERLKIIAFHHPERIEEIAEQLKSKIDEFVDELK